VKLGEESGEEEPAQSGGIREDFLGEASWVWRTHRRGRASVERGHHSGYS
jgi:hypothetical protein